MRKSKSFNLGERKVFKNTPSEKKFNPMKKYYGTISIGDKNYMVMYECDQRSEAVRLFQQEANKINGHLDKYIGVL